MKTIKLVVAVLGLCVGGVLIARSLGLFGTPTPPASQDAPRDVAQGASQPPPPAKQIDSVKPLDAPRTAAPRNELLQQSTR